jgi:hypothetical protein
MHQGSRAEPAAKLLVPFAVRHLVPVTDVPREETPDKAPVHRAPQIAS